MSSDPYPRWLPCPTCASPCLPEDRFCESCGAALDASPAAGAVARPLAVAAPAEPRTHLVEPAARPGPHALAGVPPAPGRHCDGCGDAFRDGWCSTCGARQSRPRDHFELEPAEWVAGVCDRGLRHARNEDAIAVAVRPEPVATAVLVVCDGVSSADRSDLASRAAAEAACDALVADAPAATDPVSTKILFWTGQLRAATHAAQAAAVATAGTPPSGNPPSCTLAAAVADGDLIVAAWVGDSRIYWLPDSGPATQLSVDHSWTTEQVALGVPRHVAESGSMAHAITRWLGADAPDPNPVCATVVVDGPGWLLVCSDGLWNYCPGPGEVDVVVSAASASCGGRPVDVARTLVAWANDKGGHDNVSVALARLPAPTGQVAPTAVMSSLRSAG